MVLRPALLIGNKAKWLIMIFQDLFGPSQKITEKEGVYSFTATYH